MSTQNVYFDGTVRKLNTVWMKIVSSRTMAHHWWGGGRGGWGGREEWYKPK